MKDKLSVLQGTGKTYSIDGIVFTQKPLVLKKISKMMKIVAETLGAFQKQLGEGEDLDIVIEPQTLIKFASVSEEAMEKVSDILFLVLEAPEDFKENKKDFLMNNLDILIISEVIKDMFSLNELSKVFENFQKMVKEVKTAIK